MTRWLDDDEQRTWRGFLATSEVLYAALDRQLQRDAGITHASYIVLAMLSEAPARSLRMSDLAAEIARYGGSTRGGVGVSIPV